MKEIMPVFQWKRNDFARVPSILTEIFFLSHFTYYFIFVLYIFVN